MDKIIRILPTEGANPEYAPDKMEQEGIECDGYFILTFRNDELKSAHISNLSTKVLASSITDNTDEEVVAILRQACAVAEGYIKAQEIWKEHNLKAKIMKGLANIQFPEIDMDEE